MEVFQKAHCNEPSPLDVIVKWSISRTQSGRCCLQDNAKYTYDVFKAKPLDKKEDGTPIENQDEFDEIECRKNQDIE